MLKDTRSQKQKFMDELGHQLQRRKLDTQQMNDGLLHVKWNEQKLCTVDSSGAVRFRAGDILDAEAEHQLQSVMHMAKQVKEYMQILELAPSICVHGPDDRRKVFADFGDVVLVGSAGRKIVDFATWEWDYGRSAVYAGHFFSDNYEAAKQDFAVRAGFVNGQRLFSDQQLGVIRLRVNLRWRAMRPSHLRKKSCFAAFRSRSRICFRSSKNRSRNWNGSKSQNWSENRSKSRNKRRGRKRNRNSVLAWR